MLGVALAFSVQLINDSALDEFSAAVRQVNGQADFELRGQQAGFDEALYGRVARPSAGRAGQPGDRGRYQRLRRRRPALQPARARHRCAGRRPHRARPAAAPDDGVAAGPMALLDPDAVYLNAAARQRLLGGARAGSGAANCNLAWRRVELPLRGSVAAGGAAAGGDGYRRRAGTFRLARPAVADRRAAGARRRPRRACCATLRLPAGVRAAQPDEAAQRISNVSRAYRVNLTVLALVALFTGAFLVFSILSLSVARRLPQLALLGVLGLSARERLRLVLAESALLGVARQRARPRARQRAGSAGAAPAGRRSRRRLLSRRCAGAALQRRRGAHLRRARRGRRRWSAAGCRRAARSASHRRRR